MLFELVAAILGGLLVLGVIKKLIRYSKMPPGPWGVPLVGYLPFLKPVPNFIQFRDLAKRYGDLFSINLGAHECVVINTVDIMKEAMRKREMTGRARSGTNMMFWKNLGAMFMNEGESWGEVRTVLGKAVGVWTGSEGEVKRNQLIYDVCKDLDTKIEENGAEPVTVMFEFLSPVVINFIDVLIHGGEYSSMSETGMKYATIFEDFDFSAEPGEFGFTAWTDFMPDWWRNRSKSYVGMKAFLEKEQSSGIFETDRKGGFKGIEQAVREIPKTGDAARLGRQAALEIFITQIDTSSFLTWLICLLADNPKAQAEMRKRVREYAAKNSVSSDEFWRQVQYDPYVKAATIESMRFASADAANMYLRAMEDTTLGGYYIPKDTTILRNPFGMHRDPKVFSDPDKFIPDRFLTKTLEADTEAMKNMMGFSYGKRQCLGKDIVTGFMGAIAAWVCLNYELTITSGGEFETNVETNYFQRHPGEHSIKIQPLK